MEFPEVKFPGEFGRGAPRPLGLGLTAAAAPSWFLLAVVALSHGARSGKALVTDLSHKAAAESKKMRASHFCVASCRVQRQTRHVIGKSEIDALVRVLMLADAAHGRTFLPARASVSAIW